MLSAGRHSVSLIILSLVLPSVSNVRIYRGVHNGGGGVAGGIPVVVLATGNSAASHMLNLRVNTSSCVTGPFRPHRLLTHVHTIVHHRRRPGRTSDRSSDLAFNHLDIFPSDRRIAVSRRPIHLAARRFRLLRCFTARSNGMLGHRRL